MTVTPQTNVTLEEIAEVLLKHERFCICGHINPDGDCIGSTLALASALKSIGKTVFPLVADDAEVDGSFAFMPGYDGLIPASSFSDAYDVFVTVDAPSFERLGKGACAVRDEAVLSVTLDHHAAPERMSDLSYTDPGSASTTLIIWKLAKHLGIDASSRQMRDVAACCYAGLLTDTGRFMFQNTDVEAFVLASEMTLAGIDVSGISRSLFQERTLASVRIDALAVEHMEAMCDGTVLLSWISEDDMLACGAAKADTENSINVIRSIQGADIACMLKERSDGVRGSLRAKGDRDISALARELGGGGHKAAAGFTLAMPLDEAVAFMRTKLGSFAA